MIVPGALKSRPLVVTLEQGCSTAWNFLLGTLVAKWGGLDVFSCFAIVNAIYFVLNAAVSTMSVSIASIDSARLTLSKSAYLIAAGNSANKLGQAASILGATVLIGVSFSFPETFRLYADAMGLAYITLSISGDLKRRFLSLGRYPELILLCSLLRIGALVIAASGLSFIPVPGTRTFLLFCATLLISSCFVFAVHWIEKDSAKGSERVARIVFARQLQLGRWGFASSLLMSALDQGVMLYAGIIGRTIVAGEVRAGSYVFGLLNPVMLVFDLLVPSLIFRIIGRRMNLSVVLPLVLAGMIISFMMSGVLGILNARFWLPYLGSQYLSLAPLSFWSSLTFACMTSRSFITPFLKVKAPKAIFNASVVATATGACLIGMSSDFNSLMLVRVAFFASAIQLFGNIASLVLLCIRGKLERLD